MVIIATPSKNSVTNNGKKIATYYRRFNGEKYHYNGFYSRKSEAKKIGTFRKRFDKKYRIIKVFGGYINYSSYS